MTPKQLMDDARAVREVISAAAAAFIACKEIRTVYKAAVRSGENVATLLAINDQYRQRVNDCRVAFSGMQRCLDDASLGYAGESGGDVFCAIKSRIDTWQLERVNLKDAARWCEAFASRCDEVERIAREAPEETHDASLRRLACESFDLAK